MFNWIPCIDEGARMWACPYCGARFLGTYGLMDYCSHFFCYRCGNQVSDFNPGDPDDHMPECSVCGQVSLF